ncbi:hypothetical protein [uncultured Microbacterium sp.]|uniref:hypothetical protein n=1 Tax=uncultured Microbacterium sp. TaxID=191216 RepID=UPI0035CA9447
MSGPSSSSGARGLAYILGATVVAGLVGYLIQLLAPAALTDPARYIAFTVFWSTLYLMVGTVGGLQQEVARATTASAEGSQSSPMLRTVTLWAIVVLGGMAVIIGFLIGPASFAGDAAIMAVWLGVGVAGYLLIAVFSGVLYGLRAWRIIAAVTVIDATLRGVLVTVGLLLNAPPVVLGGAVALPFGLTFLIVWAIARRTVIGRFSVDVPRRRLVTNSLGTLSAAAATGVVVTGLPLVLSITMSTQDTIAVATLISVVTITRAPLIVPLFALQSYLIVDFRGTRGVVRRLLRYGGLISLATAAGMLFAYFIGPAIISGISSGRYVVGAWPIALIVLSAGLVALLSLTGSALLAESRHAAYAAGWIVAAVATVVLLLVPTDPTLRTLTAVLVAPILGLAVHLWVIAAEVSGSGSRIEPAL